MDKTNTISIRTPEGIVFSLSLAGPVTRFLAWIIDLACIAAAMKLIDMLVKLPEMFSKDIAAALAIIAYFIVSIGYSIIMEWFFHGQTLGKRVLGLRVMDAQALRLEFSQVVIRNLLRFADSLPGFYMVGGLGCLISSKAQRLGDMAANTVVIRNRRIVEPDMDQLMEGKFNSFSDFPHLAARLRKNTSIYEAELALQALLRRDELEPAARVELFKEIAGHFKEIVQFPVEAVEGISDEQYVRNAADIVFRG